MNKKQFLYLVLAVVLFAATGLLSVSANSKAEARAASVLEQAESLFASEESTAPDCPYVAKVDVIGTIAADAALGEDFDLDGTIDYINTLIDDENNVGMLLYIDSPGGEIGAADDLYYALMDYKTLTDRPIFCYFGSYACSGGYYVAMPADEICADRNCMCVNIGVYISTYNFSGLFEKYGVEQVNFKSSENKGIGMAGTPWTKEQKEIYQSIVDIHYAQFLEIVAAGRGMTVDEGTEKNAGREMLAVQALEAGFIDAIARYGEYYDQVLSCFDEDTVIYEVEYEPSVWEELFSSLRSVSPKSETELWMDFAKAHGGMVVMAYDGIL